MDNYPSFSYPESGDSSPRSREIDFENPAPTWEEPQLPLPQPATQKVKFMVSYGGKIQPRPHDNNNLSYVGGETKILAVDRCAKFSHFRSKLASLISPHFLDAFTFKYQLPGEDLDALITVTNDEDLDHMMHEFDRLCKASSKPARLRLFLFVDHHKSQHLSQRNNSAGTGFSSLSSDRTGLDRDREPGLVSSGNQNVVVSELPQQQPMPVHSNVDFLFGLDKAEAEPVSGPVQVDPVQQQSAMFPAKNEENFGEVYRNTPSPVNIPANVQIPQGYWQPIEQQNQNQNQNHQMQQFHLQQQQPVYIMHAPPAPPAQGSMFHAPPSQGYYQVPMYGAPPAMMTAESAGYAPVNQVYYAAAQGGGVTAAYSGITTSTAAATTVVVSEEMKVGVSSGGV